MLPPVAHPREQLRLSALQDPGLLRSKRERCSEDSVTIAAQLMGTPMALVTLGDADRQWCKARIGVGLRQTSRDASFCGHAILRSRGALLVPDATRDPRFADTPLVTGDPHLRFSLGFPLRVGERAMPIGTVCTLDTQPRRVLPGQLEALAALGRVLQDHIDAQLRSAPPIAPPARA